MGTSKKSKAPSENEVLYDKLIATIPAIERKGAANPYTSLKGNMFTLLHQSRLAIRLPKDEREAFLKKHNTTLFEAYGSVMEEYVAVPDALLKNTKVSGFELRICQDAEAQAHQKEVTPLGTPIPASPSATRWKGVHRRLVVRCPPRTSRENDQSCCSPRRLHPGLPPSGPSPLA
jgi:hypothetical protein